MGSGLAIVIRKRARVTCWDGWSKEFSYCSAYLSHVGWSSSFIFDPFSNDLKTAWIIYGVELMCTFYRIHIIIITRPNGERCTYIAIAMLQVSSIMKSFVEPCGVWFIQQIDWGWECGRGDTRVGFKGTVIKYISTTTRKVNQGFDPDSISY